MPPNIEDYDVLDIIGSGSFGTCYKVRHKLSGNLFVWKAIDYGKLSEDSKKNLVSEVNLLSKLNHPNIVKYYDRILHKETTTLYIIMEWCQGGDLAKLVKNAKCSKKVLKEDFIWRVLYQVSKAVQVCHTTLCKFTVLHRDIKPANVFLDGNGNAKLGDFGLARVVEPDEDCASSLVGTPYYMSPEVVRGQRYDRKSDIWALGCLVYELCALTPPFSGTSLKDLESSIKCGKYLPVPAHYSENLVKVISFMLSVKHEYRPTIEMILHHPLVVQNIRTFQKNPKRFDEPKSIEKVCVNALKNLSMATEAEDVTQNLFRDRWMQRLEALREREAKLKEREQGLAVKERTLYSKERHLVIKERKTEDRIALAEVYLNRKKDHRVSALLNNSCDTEFSADPGDTSVLPTSTKFDPSAFPKPKFSRSKSERRDKRVTFTHERRKALQVIAARPESSSGKSLSSEGTGTLVNQDQAPLKTASAENVNRKPLQFRTRTCLSENAASTVDLWAKKGRSTRVSRAQDKENFACPQNSDGVVLKSSHRPGIFKIIHNFV